MSTGVDSIRIKGQRIEELPLGLGNEAKAQLPEVIEQERLNAIETINAEYPKHRIDYLVSRINECKENKQRMDATIVEQNTMIGDYKGHIAMCKHRDKELAKLDESDEHYTESKRLLFKQFPPYDVAAMEKQIVQCREAIERCNDVKQVEDDSITELTETHTLCKVRDKELAQYGAVTEGS